MSPLGCCVSIHRLRAAMKHTVVALVAAPLRNIGEESFNVGRVECLSFEKLICHGVEGFSMRREDGLRFAL